ncbi:MAG: T9SS type A sorting domain-containing protein, partial [Candidatus Marinimicrobia bacterium]|nr:T9SS type A sorting domain-containing protein [Candidatus Neomarinimicrobiota bacterium]
FVENEQLAGYHQITWNAANVASGVYFYRLQAGDFVQTKKMVLLK